MERIPFLGKAVSPFCLGTMHFGTVLTELQCREQLDRFVERGGNLIDSAHVYSDWIPGERSRSEKIIGRWLRSRAVYDHVILVTKGAHPAMDRPNSSRVTPACIQQDLEESLEYLGVDRIDLYFLHRDDPAVPVEELLDCLNRQIQAGRIGAIGCSNWTLARIREANEAAARRGWQGFATNQLMWSLAHINEKGLPDRYAVMDAPTHAYHAERQMPAMCFSSQAKGYFTRRYAGESLPPDVTRVYSGAENDHLYHLLCAQVAGNPAAMTDLPLAYFRSQPFPAVPIVSCDTMQQLESCFHAFDTDPPTAFPWPKLSDKGVMRHEL